MSEPIGQTTTTSLIRLVLAAYPEMKWDGIERTRSASAIGSVRACRANTYFLWEEESILFLNVVVVLFDQ